MNQRAQARRQRRIIKLGARLASSADDHMPVCTIHDPVTLKTCGRPTARASKTGLSAFVCRYHQQHKQRHGSHWCKSPSGTALRVYLLPTRNYIRANEKDPKPSQAAMTQENTTTAATTIHDSPPSSVTPQQTASSLKYIGRTAKRLHFKPIVLEPRILPSLS